MPVLPRHASRHRFRTRAARRADTSRPVSPETYEACVAHQAADLRNGLTPLVFLVSEVERHLDLGGDAPRWLAAWVASLRASLDGLAARVERLDAFPRVVPRGLSLAPSDIDLASVVREVCERRGRDALASGIALRVDAPTPVRGHWDGGGLRATVDHLVAHALQIGGRAPIDVEVGAAGNTATIAVTSRLPGGASATVAGGGLELWPVRLLCEAMNGGIDVSETADARARFTVTLPVS